MRTAADIVRTCSKFTRFEAAYRTATVHATYAAHIVMIDCPYYAVVNGREAGILRRAGYELIPTSEYKYHMPPQIG